MVSCGCSFVARRRILTSGNRYAAVGEHVDVILASHRFGLVLCEAGIREHADLPDVMC